MRKLRIMEHTSLDGVISLGGPGEDDEYALGDWTAPYRSVQGAAAVAEAYGKSFALLLGRRTYDLWAAYWPTVQGGPFAQGINAATKYVATHRPDGLAWGPVAPLGTNVMEEVRRLKSQEGPDLIVWGSSTLTAALFGQGLVDELVLIVYPVLLGRGKRVLSEEVSSQRLTLVGSKSTPTGVLIHTYRPVGSSQDGGSSARSVA